MRRASCPSEKDWQALKRVARFLLTAPRVVSHFAWHASEGKLVVFVDANWAGCLYTRKSTLGGLVLWDGMVLKSWSKTMPIIALSSAESELGAVVKGASEGLGTQAVLADFRRSVSIEVKSDATAAI